MRVVTGSQVSFGEASVDSSEMFVQPFTVR